MNQPQTDEKDWPTLKEITGGQEIECLDELNPLDDLTLRGRKLTPADIEEKGQQLAEEIQAVREFFPEQTKLEAYEIEGKTFLLGPCAGCGGHFVAIDVAFAAPGVAAAIAEREARRESMRTSPLGQLLMGLIGMQPPPKAGGGVQVLSLGDLLDRVDRDDAIVPIADGTDADDGDPSDGSPVPA